MKAIKYMAALAVITASLSGCNNTFMDRYPTTSISPEAYFKSVQDLELYTNTFYLDLPANTNDGPCDNYATYSDTHNNNDIVRGAMTPANVGGWNGWGTLRKYNILLQNCNGVSGNEDDINHYIGLTRLMRAYWYYSYVTWYNDVPWYDTPLTDTDEELLFKARDPRSLVVDKILEDLDFACKNMKESYGNRTVMSRWFALGLKSRICLAEGTWRKYHPELKLQETAEKFFEEAAKAAKEVIDSKVFSIDKSGVQEQVYKKLFISHDLSTSPEIILFRNYSGDDNIYHNSSYMFDVIIGLSRSLMESYDYVNADGTTVPYTTIPDYDSKSYVDAFKNRDPRLSQTFCNPGYTVAGTITPLRPRLNLGGYHGQKFRAETANEQAFVRTCIDVPVMRLAEVMLNYAEAKAELGSLTQADMDLTVNDIRSRVSMPALKVDALPDDPVLAAQYPDINDKRILQIRRERRIELVNEGFRWDDLNRWGAGKLIAQVQEGIYLDKLGTFDITGDGVPEMGVFKDPASNTVPEADRNNYTFYYLSEGNISLSEGDKGHVIVTNEKGNHHFDEPKSYYWPIPQTQITLNPNLKQTIYW